MFCVKRGVGGVYIVLDGDYVVERASGRVKGQYIVRGRA